MAEATRRLIDTVATTDQLVPASDFNELKRRIKYMKNSAGAGITDVYENFKVLRKLNLQCTEVGSGVEGLCDTFRTIFETGEMCIGAWIELPIMEAAWAWPRPDLGITWARRYLGLA